MPKVKGNGKKSKRGIRMLYRFICVNKSCGAEEEKEIAIKDYDEEKEKQVCSACGGKMQRLLEWSGIATGSGEGWFGKSNGGKAI